MVNIIKQIFEFFRKKEFSEVDFNVLDTYSINFKEVSDEILHKIKSVIINFREANILNCHDSDLLKSNAFEFSNIDDLLLKVRDVISEDYRETYFEANQENWIFNYFLSDGGNLKKDALLINNTLSYPEHFNLGTVTYSVLAIKKYKGKYYFWNLLEKE